MDRSEGIAREAGALLRRARGWRWLGLVVVFLRILLGFAFVPAGLKKLLGQPFTDPSHHGPFHDFLHAFHATGGFYRFVGAVQLGVAVLLLGQQFAGAVLMLPVLTVILVFCWSTAAVPTAVVVSSMWLGALGLCVWDLDRCSGLWRSPPLAPLPPPAVRLGEWRLCGAAMLLAYLLACAIDGGVYRPRGAELGDPRFYVFPAIMLLPVLTLLVQLRPTRRGRSR